MILTYKYRIKDRSARKALRRHAWAVNQVWNWCVGQQRYNESRYRDGAPKRKWASAFDLGKACKGVGRDISLHQQSVNLVCDQFTISRDRFHRTPRFRASGGPKRALGWIPFQRGSRQIDGNSITYLGKRYRFWEGQRPLPEIVKGGCFVEDTLGRWYVCFHVEIDVDRQTGNDKVGIDLGLKTLATCSDGQLIEAPRLFRQYEQRLAIAQRAKNKKRAKAITAKIKNCRKDFLHKASTKIVRQNALIAVGNVATAKLAKTQMAKSVFDAGWSMFRSQLRYKCQQAGAVYLDIDENFTTQMCSSCGAIPHSSPKGRSSLGIREWVCSECGTSHDRDVNAAQNILILALSAQRRVDESRVYDSRISTMEGRAGPIS